MSHHLLILAIACLRPATTSCLPAQADQPTVDDLIALAPVIRSGEGGHRSIELSGYINDHKVVGLLKFRAIYEAPDRYALVIRDGVDDTPFLWASCGKLIIYDPVRPVVLYGADVRTNFSIESAGNTIQFFWGWESGKETPSRISFDAKAMIAAPSHGDEVVEVGRGKYRLTRTSERGNFLVCHIDVNAKQAITKVELFMQGNDRPTFCIDKIVVDGTLADEDFAFPDKEQLAAKVDVRELGEDSLLKKLGGMALVFRGFYARLAANHPELRDMLALPGLSGTDWDEVKRHDRKFTEALKDLFPSKPRSS